MTARGLTVLPAVALAVVLAGCGGVSSPHAMDSIAPVPSGAATTSPTVPPSASASPSATAPAPTRPAAPTTSPAAYLPVTLHTSESKRTDSQIDLDIDTVTITGVDEVPGGTAQAITTSLNEAANKAISRAEGGDRMPSGSSRQPNLVTSTAAVVEADDRYVTVAATSYFYSSGAAHGNDVNDYVTFLRATGSPVTVTDLAGSAERLYSRLQTETRALLPAAIGAYADQATITSGTTAQALAAAHVFPRTDGLEVLFDAYQVASYAQGDVYVVVPWSALRGVVAADAVPTSAVAAPSMRGGTASETDDPAVTAAITASGNPALAGLGDYTLVDPTYVVNDENPYLLVQVVPAANPAGDVTVTLSQIMGPTVSSLGFTVVAAGHGSAGCTGVPESVVVTTRLQC